jgi:hypothetical protein
MSMWLRVCLIILVALTLAISLPTHNTLAANTNAKQIAFHTTSPDISVTIAGTNQNGTHIVHCFNLFGQGGPWRIYDWWWVGNTMVNAYSGICNSQFTQSTGSWIESGCGNVGPFPSGLEGPDWFDIWAGSTC